MAQITKEITVDVAKKNLFQAIVAKQNDSNSRFLKVTLCNEGDKIEVPSNATALINAERADDGSKAFAGTVNGDGTVTVPLTNWMLELDDIVRCSISIIGSDKEKLTSTSFSVEVEAAEATSSDISEDENYDILVRLISDTSDVKLACETATTAANSATDLANKATAAANASASKADTATSNANAATSSANTAAANANTAKSAAETATANAKAATTNANNAASTATQAATTATEKATAANNAAKTANDAAASANTAKANADKATTAANTAAEAAREAASAVGDNIDGIVIKDTTNSVDYLAKFRLVGGKPAIEYTEL